MGRQAEPWGEDRKEKGQSRKVAPGLRGPMAAGPQNHFLQLVPSQHMWPLCGVLCPCTLQRPTETALPAAPLQRVNIPRPRRATHSVNLKTKGKKLQGREATQHLVCCAWLQRAPDAMGCAVPLSSKHGDSLASGTQRYDLQK